jgi:predicted 3-demethylubiquinone-9 3-methyltransferase (glyoxalase superfamily)
VLAAGGGDGTSYGMQKIAPCLWFDRNCEEAVNFYLTVFPNSKITTLKRYPADIQVGPMKDMAGKVLTAIFELNGYQFQALDGGPMFTINPSVSFFVNFDPSRMPDAAAVLDAMWARLSDGGTALMPLQAYPFSKRYGWVQDRFGVSWQLMLTNPEGEPRPEIIPSQLFTGAVCGKAEEALRLYASLFGGTLGNVVRYPQGMEPNKEGSAMFAEAKLFDQWFAAMDSAAGHTFGFNEAISYNVECEDQAEVDRYWSALTAGGGADSMCGWLKDRFGFSWQIVPKRLGALLSDPDKGRADRALKAMLGMRKLDIAALERAASG